jgi:hypothetical protein
MVNGYSKYGSTAGPDGGISYWSGEPNPVSPERTQDKHRAENEDVFDAKWFAGVHESIFGNIRTIGTRNSVTIRKSPHFAGFFFVAIL